MYSNTDLGFRGTHLILEWVDEGLYCEGRVRINRGKYISQSKIARRTRRTYETRGM